MTEMQKRTHSRMQWLGNSTSEQTQHDPTGTRYNEDPLVYTKRIVHLIIDDYLHRTFCNTESTDDNKNTKQITEILKTNLTEVIGCPSKNSWLFTDFT